MNSKLSAPRTTSVLLVEDSSADVVYLRSILEEASKGQFSIEHRDRLEDAFERLAHGDIDIVLLDLNLPDSFGLNTFHRARHAAKEVPIIVLTGMDNEVVGLQAIKDGAQDYLVKGRIEGGALMRAISYGIERNRQQLDLRAASIIDDLTGLHNRRGFMTLAEQQAKQSIRRGVGVSIIFADLDGLKGINDQHGHSVGNEAISEAASLLKGMSRESDLVARLGGDEFALLVATTEAHGFHDRLDRIIGAHNTTSDRPYALSISLGVAHLAPGDDLSLDQLIAQADNEMYQKKRARKNLRGSESPASHVNQT